MSIQRAFYFLLRRKRAYRRVFGAGDSDTDMVLRDLAKFCRAHEIPATKDPVVLAMFNGRREVWLRVQQHLQLTDDDLWKLYGFLVLAKEER